MKLQKQILFATILAIIPIFMASCSGTKFFAEHKLPESQISIAMEIVCTHAFLAEYDRFAVLLENGKEIFRKKLDSDSGGYASTNLYRCATHSYVLDGYFDTWVVNLDSKTITEGNPEFPKTEYIGIFELINSEPWQFYPSSKRKEKQLEPKCK
jgi:hypothetical protein